MKYCLDGSFRHGNFRWTNLDVKWSIKDDELTQIEKHNESAYSDEDEFESEITVQDEDDGLENVEIFDEIVRDVAVGMMNVEIEPSLSR